MEIVKFFSEHGVLILGFLLALSEALALIPGIKSNGIFQLVLNILKKIKELKSPAVKE